MSEQELFKIVRTAMEAVSVGGKTFPNRLRPIPTARAIHIAYGVIVNGKALADRAGELLENEVQE